jgi:hypothetical protein
MLVGKGLSAPATGKKTNPNLLHVPQIKANWLISPPPSPPEDWEPRQEDGPNDVPYTDLYPKETANGVTLLLEQTENTPQIQICVLDH